MSVLVSVLPIVPASVAAAGSTLSVVSTAEPVARSTVAAQRTRATGAKSVSVILQVRDPALASYRFSQPASAATAYTDDAAGPLDLASSEARSYRVELASRLDRLESELVNAVPQARVTHRYLAALGGLAAIVPAESLATLSALPNVRAVYADELLQPMTDVSVPLIGAPSAWQAVSVADEAVAEGEGVVIGVLDTGVWPEHPCWSDPDPTGRAYPRPPGSYRCEFGGPHGDAPFPCNNKLVGAARFLATHDAMFPPVAGEFLSARDNEGHGTHTATTAACNRGVEATIFGISRGIISGVSPRSQVIAYKVCGARGCFASDTIAAVDQAILDGVDVLNFSVGGGGDPYTSASELAFLDAYNAGIFVAASAGNGGPLLGSVLHRGPWVTSVAASRNGRRFASTLHLRALDAPGLDLEGAGLTRGIPDENVLVEVARGDGLCEAGMPSVTPGAIVLCDRGGSARPAKSYHAAAAGAAGMILRNLFFQGVASDNHYLPSVHLEADDGDRALAYLLDHPSVTGTISAGAAQADRPEVLAAFSARGGPSQALGVGKPDLTAPGVQILAGHTAAPFPEGQFGPPGELFQVIQGTSMSSPHVAGAAALLRGLHPQWGPGRIKSALMTTAQVRQIVLEDEQSAADAYAYGSGRIDLRRAWDPHLTISTDGSAYLELADELWNSNHPSAHLSAMPGRITLHRTLRSETAVDTLWKARAATPPGVRASVSPRRFELAAGATVDVRVRIDAGRLDVGQDAIVEVRFNDGERIARMPISLVRRQPDVAIDTTCAPTELAVGGSATCELVLSNAGIAAAQVVVKERSGRNVHVVADGAAAAALAPLSVSTDGRLVGRLTLAGGSSPQITVDDGRAPFGYVPLAGFEEIVPLAPLADDEIVDVAIPPVSFAGARYTRIGVASNGFVVLGGGAASDAAARNQSLPDRSLPNNVLAPAWSDYDPSRGGTVRIGTLTNGVGFWTVVDWQDMPNADGSGSNSFQIWLGHNAEENVSFAYGAMTGGSEGRITVGAENIDGTSGGTAFYDGNGAFPDPGTAFIVTARAASAGETRRFRFDLRADRSGPWRACTRLRSTTFQGTNIVCANGVVR